MLTCREHRLRILLQALLPRRAHRDLELPKRSTPWILCPHQVVWCNPANLRPLSVRPRSRVHSSRKTECSPRMTTTRSTMAKRSLRDPLMRPRLRRGRQTSQFYRPLITYAIGVCQPPRMEMVASTLSTGPSRAPTAWHQKTSLFHLQAHRILEEAPRRPPLPWTTRPSSARVAKPN